MRRRAPTSPLLLLLLLCHAARATYDAARNTSSFRVTSRAINDAAWRAHLKLQQSKFRQSDAIRLKIMAIDVGRQDQVARQFAASARDGTAGIRSFKGEPVLCLGARLGGEVRAFKSLGALAIGVDFEPGQDSMDVLAGDFENLAFAEATFKYAYSNVLDHLHDLRRFASEACRVLKPGGTFFAALFSGRGDRWNGRQGISADAYGPLVDAMQAGGMFALAATTQIRETMQVRQLARAVQPGFTGSLQQFLPWQQELKTLYFRRASNSCSAAS